MQYGVRPSQKSTRGTVNTVVVIECMLWIYFVREIKVGHKKEHTIYTKFLKSPLNSDV